MRHSTTLRGLGREGARNVGARNLCRWWNGKRYYTLHEQPQPDGYCGACGRKIRNSQKAK